MRVPIRSLAFVALLVLAVAPVLASDEAASPAQAPADVAQLHDCAPFAQGTSTIIPDGNAVPVCSEGDPQVDVGLLEPIEEMGPPFRRGYCRCGCGLTCETDADCGGVSCDPFITCC